jgi:hypothetical protein
MHINIMNRTGIPIQVRGIVNKYSPIKKMRIKNRFSPWFDRDLAELLHIKNIKSNLFI